MTDNWSDGPAPEPTKYNRKQRRTIAAIAAKLPEEQKRAVYQAGIVGGPEAAVAVMGQILRGARQ